MYYLLFLIILLVLVFILFLRHSHFGSLPKEERMKQIKKSRNYRNGNFQNLQPTPVFTGEKNFFKVFRKMAVIRSKRSRPKGLIPSLKTNIKDLELSENVLIWFGHSSFFLQFDGKRILIDPVFSRHASPVSFFVRAFKGSSPFTCNDLPDIDYLFITHDHWDHLDYSTVIKLKNRTSKVVCGLGTGAHFERWGFPKEKIIEGDWYDEIELEKNFVVHFVPARHFSGRYFKRNQSLWTAFLLQFPQYKIYISGDGGYGHHFEEAGKRFGPIDLALLENGQYNLYWKHIHCLPEEMWQAAEDLTAKYVVASHSSKFCLSLHDWDEPLKKAYELFNGKKITLLTPIIGECVYLNHINMTYPEWWQNIN